MSQQVIINSKTSGLVRFVCALTVVVCALAPFAGCGTTRWSDTQRTATEQMLLSDAIDKQVNRLDFRMMRDKSVYFRDDYLRASVDQGYLASSLRNHLLASGCILKENIHEADYVVEARAGAVGTDRHDVLFGVSGGSIPAGVPNPTGVAAIPELSFIKRTDQWGVAKVALFAYNRTTGRIVWQSGISPSSSDARDVWVLGAGPFQRGSIRKGTKFAGDRIRLPLTGDGSPRDEEHQVVSVQSEATFEETPEEPEPILPNPVGPNGQALSPAETPATPAGYLSEPKGPQPGLQLPPLTPDSGPVQPGNP